MITLKTASELDSMRQAGRIAATALRRAGEAVRPGVTTAEIDRVVLDTIRSMGAEPSFLGYNGFPASACVSINDIVIHGIPGPRVIHEGDIVSLDIGALWEGFHGDTAATFPVGDVSAEAMRLIEVTRGCFDAALEFAREGYRISDISRAVQSAAEGAGCGVVRDFTGHGVGRALHEDPDVPNFVTESRGVRLIPGMTIAIEPMINMGTGDIFIERNGWTVRTADGRLSAHHEHTVLITSGAPVLLTEAEEDTA